MGLSLQPTRRLGGKLATVIAVLALIAQPMYGLVASHVASALSEQNTVCDDVGACDYTSIKQAISNVAPGSTINVKAGAYSEGLISVDKSVKLMGESRNTTFINGQIKISAPGVAIDNFGIDTTEGSGGYSVYIKADATSINKNTFRSNTSTTSAKAIFVEDGSSNTSINGNTINAVSSNAGGAYGILAKDVTGLTVSNNSIKNLNGLWATAIGLEGNTPNAVVTNNTVKNLTSRNYPTSTAVKFEENPSAASVSLTGNLYGSLPLVKNLSNVVVDKALPATPATTPANTYPEFEVNGELRYANLNVFSEVQPAISAVNPGGAVSVGAGEYKEDIIIDKKVDLKSTVKQAATIDGQVKVLAPGARVQAMNIKTSAFPFGYGYSVGVFAPNVMVDNNRISTTSTGDSAKAIIVSSDNANISGNTIRNVVSPKGAYGVLTNEDIEGLKVYWNNIDGLTGDWVAAIGLESDTPYAEVSNNTIGSNLTGTTHTPQAVSFEENPGAATVGPKFIGNTYGGKELSASTTEAVVNSQDWSDEWTKSKAKLNKHIEVFAGNSNGNKYYYLGLNAFITAQDAVNAVDENGTVKLLTDQSVTSPILIKKALTFDGNGLSVVSSLGAGATTPYSGVIEVQSVTGGTVRFIANNNKNFRVYGEGDKAIDGHGSYNGLHGINVWKSNVELQNVILSNNGKSGLNLGQNSNGVVRNLTTLGNMWHGVNVDKSATMDISGVSKHTESKTHNSRPVAALYIDSPQTGTIVDQNTQYVFVENYLAPGDRAYFLKSAAPVAPSILGFTQNSADRSVVNVESGSSVNTNGTSPNTTHMLWATGTDIYSKDSLRAIRYEVTYPNGNKATSSDHNGPMGVNFVSAWVGGTFGPKNTRQLKDDSAEGLYSYRLQVQHANGLWSDWSAPATLSYDITAPTVTISEYTTPFTTGRPTIEGTVTGEDTASVEVSLDNGDHWLPATLDGTHWTFTYPTDSPALTNGDYTILARATDQTGNISDAASRTFIVDITSTAPPTVTPPSSPSVAVTTGPLIDNSLTTENNIPAAFVGFAPNFQLPTANNEDIEQSTDDNEGEVAAAVVTDNDDNGEVKAAEDVKDSWSLINLLLTIAVAAASIFALIGLAGKKEDRNIGARLLTVVPALGAGAVLLFAEDFSGQMSWVNIWTLLVGALLVVQMIILANTKSQAE